MKRTTKLFIKANLVLYASFLLGIILFYLAPLVGITEGRSLIFIALLVVATIINAGFYGFGPLSKHFRKAAEHDKNIYNKSLKTRQPWE